MTTICARKGLQRRRENKFNDMSDLPRKNQANEDPSGLTPTQESGNISL